MAKVLGIGGIFYTARDKKALAQWYRDVLGMAVEPWNGVAFRPQDLAALPNAAIVWSLFDAGSEYLAPSAKPFMINFVVDDLDGVLAQCKAHGVVPIKLTNDDPSGRFAHIMDPEGTKIELWEPKSA